jgi:hypothetical protein
MPELASLHACGIPDWYDASAYARLLEVERAGLAWEWLRRQHTYAAAARAARHVQSGASGLEDRRALAWNLHAFENPDRAAPDARPIWAAAAHPWTVRAHATGSRLDGDAFQLDRLSRYATLVSSGAWQRLLLSDGFRSIRIDLRGADVRASAVRLTFELTGIDGLKRPLLVLQRLRALVMNGRFRTSLHPRFQKAARLILLLRAHDALRCGASQADIAQLLLRPALERARWRIHSPSIRSQAQRLVGAARRMSEGAFWQLLD